MTNDRHSDLFQHGYALIIGVGRTSKQLKWSLPTTVRDAQRVRQVFTDLSLCAYPIGQVHLLTDGSASQKRIGAELTSWLRSQAEQDTDSTVVVYFSGHGWRTDDGRYALIPSDVNPDDMEKTVIWGDVFSKALGEIPCKRLLVILDCCYAAGVGALKGELDPPPKGFQSGAPTGSLVAALKEGEGRVIISSSRDDQTSWIRKDGEFSIFTYHLVEALEGAATPANMPEVRLAHIVDHLSETVPQSVQNDWKAWNAAQTPWVEWKGENYAVALHRGGKGLTAPLRVVPETNRLTDLPSEPPKLRRKHRIDKVLELLETALTEEQLSTLVFSHYRTVHSNFGNQNAHTRRLKLVEYAESQGRIEELTEQIRTINPRRLSEYENDLYE